MKQKNQHINFIFGAPSILWQFLFFALPILVILIGSFVEVSPTGKWSHFTTDGYTQFFTPFYFKIIGSSICLALFVAFTCLLIGYPIAYFMHFKAKHFKNLMLFLLMIPFWTSFLLHVYAWYYVLENHGVINTILLKTGLIKEPLHLLGNLFAIILMMVYTYLPFAILPLYSSLESFDSDLLEASADLGATWKETVYKILIPLTEKGIKASFFLVFIPCFGEFAIPELMGGDKRYFVGNIVSFFVLGDEGPGRGEAFTLLSMAILALTAFIVFKFINRLIGGNREPA